MYATACEQDSILILLFLLYKITNDHKLNYSYAKSISCDRLLSTIDTICVPTHPSINRIKNKWLTKTDIEDLLTGLSL